MKKNVKSVVFGSKKLFKNQFTLEEYKNNHESWLKNYEQARYNQLLVSGRYDAKSGNFVFHYRPENKLLSFRTPNGTVVQIEDLTFPYGKEKINDIISTQLSLKDKKKGGKPIAWGIEDHGDYYIFKCTVEEDESPNKNYSKADGVIGIDCNWNHFAISNINHKGQLLDSYSLHFDILGKSSNQITKIIEAEAIAVVDYAVKHNKPLVLEKLNTTKSKVSHAYGSKKGNQRMSLFAYGKMLSAIKSRAEKLGVVFFEVNPAYTSQIGKMKYMKRLGISIHEAASYVIARRAMKFKEKLPPVLHSLLPEKMVGLHHWAQWKYIASSLSGIRVHAFYQVELSDRNRCVSQDALFQPGALSDLEKKGLSKLESRKSIS